MNVVYRLMCRDELETYMRGDVVLKGNKGNEAFRKLVGSDLSFSPIKFCDMVSLGDLSAIFANMKGFFVDYAARDARVRNSKVYMVVFEEVEGYVFRPHMGDNYLTKFSEPSKELLIDEYSMNDLKPLRLYEIDFPQELERDFSERYFNFDRTPIEGYKVKMGFPVQVDSYEEAVNDMLHVFFSEEEIRKIYDGFELLRDLDYLSEELSEDRDVWEEYCDTYKELYGREYGESPWRNIDKFEDEEYEYHQREEKMAEQAMKTSVDRNSALDGTNKEVRQELTNLTRQVARGKENIIEGTEIDEEKK